MFVCMNNNSVSTQDPKRGKTQMGENKIPTNSSSFFPSGLIEPSLYIVLPMLLKMPIRDDIVVLHQFLPVNSRYE